MVMSVVYGCDVAYCSLKCFISVQIKDKVSSSMKTSLVFFRELRKKNRSKVVMMAVRVACTQDHGPISDVYENASNDYKDVPYFVVPKDLRPRVRSLFDKHSNARRFYHNCGNVTDRLQLVVSVNEAGQKQ